MLRIGELGLAHFRTYPGTSHDITQSRSRAVPSGKLSLARNDRPLDGPAIVSPDPHPAYWNWTPAMIAMIRTAATRQSTAAQNGGHHLVLATY